MKEKIAIVLQALELMSVSGRRNCELMVTVMQTLEQIMNEEGETDVSDQRE